MRLTGRVQAQSAVAVAVGRRESWTVRATSRKSTQEDCDKLRGRAEKPRE